MDERDLEIARLKGQVEGLQLASRRPSGGVVAGTFKVLVTLALIAVAIVGAIMIWHQGRGESAGGYQQADFARVCARVASGRAIQSCQDDLAASYQGADIEERKQNAADVWASLNQNVAGVKAS